MTDGDVSRFQIDILSVLASHGPLKGLDVKYRIEQLQRYDSVSQGRLYSNLNGLFDQGLVDKEPLNERSNHYEITGPGVTVLRQRYETIHAGLSELDPTTDEGES